ncbi:hypothetical protein PV08_11611 [Exophiala spinifera]|uniref:Uncharacterized protein n=1 Tax=Exophiala spinifera TaxID=91928 RepID=A0A0D1ZC94_9EURO|nr:uncharacterized protein PV08_11611 [Exophiala spinifera]KIW10647.1 hypothetical protein PV08_11611 [Exophiala spinifera]
MGRSGIFRAVKTRRHNKPPDEKNAVYAKPNPEDGFIMLSSCYHGGSTDNRTDEERFVTSCFMTLDVAKCLPIPVQKLMGYTANEVSQRLKQ